MRTVWLARGTADCGKRTHAHWRSLRPPSRSRKTRSVSMRSAPCFSTKAGLSKGVPSKTKPLSSSSLLAVQAPGALSARSAGAGPPPDTML